MKNVIIVLFLVLLGLFVGKSLIMGDGTSMKGTSTTVVNTVNGKVITDLSTFSK